MSFDPSMEQTGLRVSERARVLAQLRRVLKDLQEFEAFHRIPALLTRDDLLQKGLTDAAIDRIARLLSYFANPSGGGRDVFARIEAADAAAVQQLADIVAKQNAAHC